MSSILFKNADVLIRRNDGYKKLHQAFLGVRDDKIDYIGLSEPELNYDEIKDYRHKLLMPGLVNTHCHSPMVFLRGYAHGVPLDIWLNEKIFPIEASLTPEHIESASYFAMLELLAAGTTSFTDMYFFPEQTAKAVIDSGIKANINKYIMCFDENQRIEDSQIGPSVEFFKKYHNSANGKLKVDFSMHAEYTNKEHIVKEYSRLCKQYGANMHIHMSESKKEHEECIQRYGKTPAEFFRDCGTFDSPTTAAHCVHCTDSDIDILKQYNVSVAHNATSNMMLGNGIAPIKKMVDKGVNVTLGTDGVSSNNNMNMFQEIHLTALIHNGVNHDPNSLTTTEVIDMATINGAKSQGRFDTGELKVGNKADIIALDLHKPHLFPNFETTVLLCFSAQGSDVCMTMVDGKILYEDGNYLTLDKEKIIKNFKRTARDFYSDRNIVI